MQSLGGRFIVFFGGQNHNFMKVKELKLRLNIKLILHVKDRDQPFKHSEGGQRPTLIIILLDGGF